VVDSTASQHLDLDTVEQDKVVLDTGIQDSHLRIDFTYVITTFTPQIKGATWATICTATQAI